MDHREELHGILVDILGSNQVYFQPPESVRMQYPAFVYFIDNYPSMFANDDPYRVDEKYLVTFITRDPVSPIPKQVASTHGFRFDRQYVADNLHHSVFTYIHQ